MSLSSCVHEFPETDGLLRKVELNVSHDLEWTHKEISISRASYANQDVVARYHFRIFNSGETSFPVADKVFTSLDLQRNDFKLNIHLPVGSYDLYAWSDYADFSSEKSLFFSTSDFGGIIYNETYQGANELRDAFRGFTTFSVEHSVHDDYQASAEILLSRPLARYEFRATDLRLFLDKITSNGKSVQIDGSSDYNSDVKDISGSVPDLSDYKVKMTYSGYMPSKYNNLLDRPVDSKIGMTYEAQIEVVNADEARLGFDHVMIGHNESSIPVAMEIYDPHGILIARSGTIDVPTLRGRNTIIRGRFLTSVAQGGVGINPDFSGDINIEIK